MRAPLGLSTLALLSLTLAACGGTEGSDSATSVASSHAPSATQTNSSVAGGAKDSNDLDGDANSVDDDLPIVDYGHAASPAEARAIEVAIRSYYAAAAAANDAKACAMLVPNVAEAVPEEVGHPKSSAELSGKTCANVIATLFGEDHRRLASELASLRVTRARVQGDKGLAILSFTTTPEPRKMPVRREGGVWKMREVLDSGMP
jgi:hypothetical protein